MKYPSKYSDQVIEIYQKYGDEPDEKEESSANERKLTSAQLKEFLNEPEKKQQIIDGYTGGYSTGSIAKSLGLPQDKASRTAIRALLRKAGVYKEKVKPAFPEAKQPAKQETGFEGIQEKLHSLADQYAKEFAPPDENIWYAGSAQQLAVFRKFMTAAGVKNGKEMIASTLNSWTGSSHGKGAAIMKAVACELYGKDLEFEPKLKYPASDLKKDAQQFKDALLAQKAFTKAYVKKYGAKKVYRGLRGKVVEELKKQIAEGKTEVEITANSLSSWSISSQKSKSFAGGAGGVILSMKPDPDHVWAAYAAQPFSSFSRFKSEEEYVMGMPGKSFKIRKEDIQFL